MPGSKENTLGQMLRRRRRQLDLTQKEVARRIKVSAPYVGSLESGRRHPSHKILARLATVLGLDKYELFLIAYPIARSILRPATANPLSAWEQFKNDDGLRRRYSITKPEMEMLSRVALLGEVHSPSEFIYVLNSIRQAIGQ